VKTLSGSDTIWTAAKSFGSVAVGQQVYGAGVRFGATVTALVDADLDSAIILSDTCMASATVSLQFGYFASAAYARGDWLGLPFKIYENLTAGVVRLVSVAITDNADQLDSTDIVFMRPMTVSGGAGLDNAALAVAAADAGKILGTVPLTKMTDLGSTRVLESTSDIGLALPESGQVWARLIVRSAPTYTAVNNLTVKLRFMR
jgi:hypothetical protein